MAEFGIVMEASPGFTAPLARDIEQLGFDVLLCPDTQNLSPDPFGQLALAAQTFRQLTCYPALGGIVGYHAL